VIDMQPVLSLLFATIALVPVTQEITVKKGPEPARSNSGKATEVIYDVHDLLDYTNPLWDSPTDLAAAAEASGDESGAQPSLELGYAPDLELKKQRRANLGELARIVMAFSEPSFEEIILIPGEGRELPSRNRIDCIGDGQLLVSAGLAQQAFVRDFLALQRASTATTRISFRLVTGAKDSFGKLGLPISGTLAEPEKSQTLAQLANGGFDLVTAPMLTVRPLQRGDLSCISQFSYVKEYHTQIVQPGGDLISDPVIDVINEGVLCSVRAVALPSGSFGLSIDVQSVEVLRPVRTKNVRVAAGVEQEGEIMLPEILRARLSGDVRLADGATAVFVTPLTEDKDMALFVTLELESTAPGAGEGK
jgi:hypothetical protein